MYDLSRARTSVAGESSVDVGGVSKVELGGCVLDDGLGGTSPRLEGPVETAQRRGRCRDCLEMRVGIVGVTVCIEGSKCVVWIDGCLSSQAVGWCCCCRAGGGTWTDLATAQPQSLVWAQEGSADCLQCRMQACRRATQLRCPRAAGRGGQSLSCHSGHESEHAPLVPCGATCTVGQQRRLHDASPNRYSRPRLDNNLVVDSRSAYRVLLFSPFTRQMSGTCSRRSDVSRTGNAMI